MAEARGAYRKFFLDAVCAVDDIELVLHFGDHHSDFDVPSLARQEIKAASKGRLLSKPSYTGANLALLTDPEFQEKAELFAEHLIRNSKNYNKRPHKMSNLHEYLDYYHILTDCIAQKIIENQVTHAIFFDVPHLAIDTAIYDVARSLGVKTLILSQYFPNKFFSSERLEDIGKFDFRLMTFKDLPKVEKASNYNYFLDEKWQKESPRGKLTFRMILNFYRSILLQSPQLILDFEYQKSMLNLMHETVSNLPCWRTPFSKFFDTTQLEYLQYLVQYEKQSVNFNMPYVYIPLHFQPEMTTSSLGGIHRDQLLIIERLSAILPVGWKLYVKENPKQGPYARGAMFFHRLNRVPHVQMVPADTDTNTLTLNAKIVATVTGTAAIEAVEAGIPAITFGYAWYKSLPGIEEFSNLTNLEKHSQIRINIEEVMSKKAAILSMMHEGNLDKGFFKLVEHFDEKNNIEKVGQAIKDLLLGNIQTTFRSF